MKMRSTKLRKKYTRSCRGAIFTVCFAAFLIPVTVAFVITLVQSAVCYCNKERLHYAVADVIEHFDSISQMDESTFDHLLSALAQANNLQLQNLKTRISSSEKDGEETIEIKVSCSFYHQPGLIAFNWPFVEVYRVKRSQLDTFGYLAVNGYPYSATEPSRGLSTYLPLYRPSAAVPTWRFAQNNAIGAVRKCVFDTDKSDDQQSSNWKQVGEDLLSIY